MNKSFQFIISFVAIIPLFIPFQVEYIDALDFDNDSVEQNILPYINTIKNENYKKQKIDFNAIEDNAKIEYTSKIETKEEDGNKDNSGESTKKQETSYENFTVYEGLGIKLENLNNNLVIHAKLDKPLCVNINLCFIHLGIVNATEMPQLWVIQDSFESQTVTEYCKCNTLEGYIEYSYNTIAQFDNFSFINQNQINFAGDKSAIQIEYEFSARDTNIHVFTIFTQDNNSFYQFSYYVDKESYSNYFADFEKVTNTIEFTQKNLN